MSTIASKLPHRGVGPVPKAILGVILLAFFVLGSILHIQTSEAFFLGKHGTLVPDFSVLAQPILLALGKIDPMFTEAVIWGWVIELVFLICVVGYEYRHRNPWMGRAFRTGMIAMIVFDGYTDYVYGPASFWGQVAFAVSTAFVVFFFGTIGAHLLEDAWKEWKAGQSAAVAGASHRP